jgi:hypothetical protein
VSNKPAIPGTRWDGNDPELHVGALSGEDAHIHFLRTASSFFAQFTCYETSELENVTHLLLNSMFHVLWRLLGTLSVFSSAVQAGEATAMATKSTKWNDEFRSGKIMFFAITRQNGV